MQATAGKRRVDSQPFSRSAGSSLLVFSTSHIRAFAVSVILANHTEPLRANAAFLFRERRPSGHTFALREPVWLFGYDGYDKRMFGSLKTPYA
jgi:hypothetical protein